MEYNITYRKKDKGIQVIISYKDSTCCKWRQKSKQGFEDSRKGKKEAKQWADYMLQQLKNQNPSNELEDITLGEFWDTYIEHLKLHLTANTLIGYRTTKRKFSNLLDYKLNKLKIIHIKDVVDSMVKEGLNTDTINLYIFKLQKILKAAYEDYEINCIHDLKKVKLKAITKTHDISLDKALTKNELESMLSKINNINYYNICLIASKCGLRIGEILGLTWDCIDFKKGEIYVYRQWSKQKDGTHFFGDTKNKKTRFVPAPPIVLNSLKKLKTSAPININNRLFNYINTQSTCSNLHREFIRCGYDITIHDLRHTYTTNIISAGVDFKTAAEFIGDTVEMVMSVYSHVNSEMKERAKNIINNI